MSLKALHDQLLAEKPDGAEHDPAECPLCAEQIQPNGGKKSMETFTKEEVEAQIAQAVATVREELDALKASQSAAEVEAKIAAIQAEADEKIADLQSQLDAKVIEAESSKKTHDDLVAFLDAEKVAAEEAAAAEARKEDRVKSVTEVASFPEDYVTANADRWAAMSDEDFETVLADYKAVAEKASAGTGTGSTELPPRKTALHAEQDPTTKATGSATRSLFEKIRSGVDPRTVTR